MNPGDKVICVNTAAFEYWDIEEDEVAVSQSVEDILTVGNIYTVKQFLLWKDHNFSYSRVVIEEVEGAFALHRFKKVRP